MPLALAFFSFWGLIQPGPGRTKLLSLSCRTDFSSLVAAQYAAHCKADEVVGRADHRYGRGTPRHGMGFFLAQRVHVDVAEREIAPGALKTSLITKPMSASV